MAELSALRFIEERRDVILLGPPGVGNTQLAIARGVAATAAGSRTSFTSAADLVHPPRAAHLEGSVLDKPRAYLSPSVLVIDELGYLPLDQASATWTFPAVSRRADRGSIILASNRGFGDWGQVLADPVVASAILRQAQDRPAPGQRQRAEQPRPQLPRACLPGPAAGGLDRSQPGAPRPGPTPVRYGSRYGSAALSCARARDCSDAGKQRADRLRQGDPASSSRPTPAAATGRPTDPAALIVSACPVGDARYLGERRCPDGNRFCRELGPGGACPHCDEPVLIAELLGKEVLLSCDDLAPLHFSRSPLCTSPDRLQPGSVLR